MLCATGFFITACHSDNFTNGDAIIRIFCDSYRVTDQGSNCAANHFAMSFALSISRESLSQNCHW